MKPMILIFAVSTSLTAFAAPHVSTFQCESVDAGSDFHLFVDANDKLRVQQSTPYKIDLTTDTAGLWWSCGREFLTGGQVEISVGTDGDQDVGDGVTIDGQQIAVKLNCSGEYY